jgi:hypothetical protein
MAAVRSEVMIVATSAHSVLRRDSRKIAAKPLLNRSTQMETPRFAKYPFLLSALLLTLSLPLASAFAADDGGSPVPVLGILPPTGAPTETPTGSCVAKAPMTAIVAARPSDNMIAQPSDWKDSGIVVDRCHTTIISAAGLWRYSATPTDPAVSGGGTKNYPCDVNQQTGLFDAPLPTAPCGSLIGKVGPDGKPFLIGAGPAEVPAGSEGKLYLIINDWEFGDNSGELNVTATFNLAPATARR